MTRSQLTVYSLGGVFYVLFWCLLGFWLLPRARPGRIALAVLAVTCLLEFLPRWHPAWLECLWRFWSDQILLGTTFTGLGPLFARRPAGGDRASTVFRTSPGRCVTPYPPSDTAYRRLRESARNGRRTRPPSPAGLFHR